LRFSFGQWGANGHSTPRHAHDDHSTQSFEDFQKDNQSPSKLFRVAFGAHFTEKFGILDGAQEKRNPGVGWGGEGPEAGIARMGGWPLWGGEQSGVIMGEEEENGVYCDSKVISRMLMRGMA
jgi:hypothetical protein